MIELLEILPEAYPIEHHDLLTLLAIVLCHVGLFEINAGLDSLH